MLNNTGCLALQIVTTTMFCEMGSLDRFLKKRGRRLAGVTEKLLGVIVDGFTREVNRLKGSVMSHCSNLDSSIVHL